MIFSNKFLKPLLFVISQVFKSFVLLRLFAYRKGWLKTNRVNTLVISVGNLTVGGTGKTPVVDLLVKELQRLKKQPAVLSRGYKRKDASSQQRLRFCEDSKIDPAFFGDEPYLLAQRNPEVPVYVGSSRFITAGLAEKQDHPDILLLDDAYQHLAIHRDLNLLLIDAEQGLGNRHLLPFGVLREPVNQWKRADAIILTKTNLAASNAVSQMLKHELQVSCPVFNFKYEVQGLTRLDGEVQLNLNEIKNKRLLLTSGIAQPKGFERLLEQQDVEIIGKIEFPDHHDYSTEDVRKILEQQQILKPDYLLTTEKDAVKLRSFAELAEQIWVLEMEMIPDNLWNDFLAEFLRHKFETQKNGK
jgi:tetraacyldisaccharide 4'-kinase